MAINIAAIAKEHGVKPRSLWRRIKVDGMTVEEALAKPWRGKQPCSIEGCTQKHEAKGLCKEHYGMQHRHGDPLARQRARPGTGWLSKGYKYLSDKPEHVLIAEKALQKELPKGAVVHHASGNFTDNSNSNLVICPSQAYHMLLHRRLNAYLATGNPTYRKCFVCKEYDDPENLYVRGNHCVHRACRNARQVKIRQQRKQQCPQS